MTTSIFTRKIQLPKPNWWLWICLSVPLCLYLLTAPTDPGGWVDSDWNTFMDWIRNNDFSGGFWRSVGGIVFGSILPSIVFGGIAQCIIMFFGSYSPNAAMHLVKKRKVK